MQRARWWFGPLLLVFAWGIVEAGSFVGLELLERFFGQSWDPTISRLSEAQREKLEEFVERYGEEDVGFDPVLGWVPAGYPDGVRDDRHYDPLPPPGVVRIAAFGDSFTHGSGVELEEVWSKRLAALDDGLEVLNYGVGGYGFDQAYLRYREVGAERQPHIVVLGYMSENLSRNVNVFRAFYTSYYRKVIWTKPRFVLDAESGELTLLENPLSTKADYQRFLAEDERVLRELGRNDYHYRTHYTDSRFDFLASVRLLKMVRARLAKRLVQSTFGFDGEYNTGSEAYRLTEALFDAFYAEALERGSLPIILVFPDMHDQHRQREGKPRRYAPLLDHFEAKGYRYVDALASLEPFEDRYTVDELIVDWGHFSPVANEILARSFHDHLDEQGLLEVATVQEAVRRERERLAN